MVSKNRAWPLTIPKRFTMFTLVMSAQESKATATYHPPPIWLLAV